MFAPFEYRGGLRPLLPTLALLAVLFPVVGLQAQDIQTEQSPEEQELIAQIQQIQAHLDQIHTQVFQAVPELVSERDEIEEMVYDAMRDIHPEVDDDIERLQGMGRDAETAQLDGDMERLTEIISEAERIRDGVEAVQQAALEREDVQQRVDAFEDRVIQEMVRIDPDAENLMEEFETLVQRLNEISG